MTDDHFRWLAHVNGDKPLCLHSARTMNECFDLGLTDDYALTAFGAEEYEKAKTDPPPPKVFRSLQL